MLVTSIVIRAVVSNTTSTPRVARLSPAALKSNTATVTHSAAAQEIHIIQKALPRRSPGTFAELSAVISAAASLVGRKAKADSGRLV